MIPRLVLRQHCCYCLFLKEVIIPRSVLFRDLQRVNNFISRFCKNKAVCGACGGQHERRACQVPEQLLKPKCCNCRGAHPAWASVCPVRQEAAKKAREAWNTRPGKYEIPTATSVPALQPSSVMSFPLSQSLPGGKKHKTAEPSRSSERLRGALPEVQILSSRSANSGGKLPANSFKIFDAEMSA